MAKFKLPKKYRSALERATIAGLKKEVVILREKAKKPCATCETPVFDLFEGEYCNEQCKINKHNIEIFGYIRGTIIAHSYYYNNNCCRYKPFLCELCFNRFKATIKEYCNYSEHKSLQQENKEMKHVIERLQKLPESKSSAFGNIIFILCCLFLGGLIITVIDDYNKRQEKTKILLVK